MEELQPLFLEGGREVLRLLFDQVLTGVKVLGDEVAKVPRGGAGGQVIGLDGELDVQDLSVGAQHVPRHVHLHEYQLVVDDLREDGWASTVTLGSKNSSPTAVGEVQHTHGLRGLQFYPHLHQTRLKKLSPPLQRSSRTASTCLLKLI